MTVGVKLRDFIYVEDVIDGILATASVQGNDRESIDLGPGEAHTARILVERIWHLAGGAGEIHAGELPYRHGEAIRLVADADHAAARTGWRVRTSLDDGHRRTIDEFSHSVA